MQTSISLNGHGVNLMVAHTLIFRDIAMYLPAALICRSFGVAGCASR